MLTVIKQGKPNGVQYSTNEKRFYEHHEQFDETLILFDTPILFDNEGNLLTPFNLTKDEIKANHLRAKRVPYCFDIVNRGQVWYDTLSDDQRDELKIWYQGWLDAPQSLKEPTQPDWL